ncbi:MAG TPA: response regulator [Caulobacteraceae bacterium]|jgi:DNA-binding response OmpR family regulator
MSRKVLIVEDEPELLTLMADSFRRADIEVYTARNGEVGLELFRTVQPDLVITDIVMPAKEGVQLIMDIKRTGLDTRVIAISGGGVRSCKDYLRWAKELGAALVLQKPFRMSVLLMMARFLMEKAANAQAFPTQSLPGATAGRAAGDPFDDLFEEPLGSAIPSL